jgi:hypothetical protein
MDVHGFRMRMQLGSVFVSFFSFFSFFFCPLSEFSAAGEFILSYWQKLEWFLSYLITKYEFFFCRNHHILHQVLTIGSQQYGKMLKFSYFHVLAKFDSVVLWT